MYIVCIVSAIYFYALSLRPFFSSFLLILLQINVSFINRELLLAITNNFI